MKRLATSATVLVSVFVSTSAVFAAPNELNMHLAQSNNDSPYAFVRAKFEPKELSDPWAVRFFDGDEKEVPYFVWDAINWREAREGRSDWGGRYAALNHANGDSVCAAMYLLRHRVPAFGKERLTLRI